MLSLDPPLKLRIRTRQIPAVYGITANAKNETLYGTQSNTAFNDTMITAGKVKHI